MRSASSRRWVLVKPWSSLVPWPVRPALSLSAIPPGLELDARGGLEEVSVGDTCIAKTVRSTSCLSFDRSVAHSLGHVVAALDFERV